MGELDATMQIRASGHMYGSPEKEKKKTNNRKKKKEEKKRDNFADRQKQLTADSARRFANSHGASPAPCWDN
jgi:hypothetical protein